MPEVDQHFLGTDEVGAINEAIGGAGRRVRVAETPRFLYDDIAPRRPSMATHTAYVKIAEGCDRPCAFCIIPKLRGPQRSRDPESVLREARALAEAGTKEICLVAQGPHDVRHGSARTRRRSSAPLNLASLLRGLGGVEGPCAGFACSGRRLSPVAPVCTNELLDVMAGKARVAEVPGRADPAHRQRRAQVPCAAATARKQVR